MSNSIDKIYKQLRSTERTADKKIAEQLLIAKAATELCSKSSGIVDVFTLDYAKAIEIIKIQKLDEIKNELAKLSR